MTKGSWGASRRSLAQVEHITHDWLTPCEYLPYIDALLGDIDLKSALKKYPEPIVRYFEEWNNTNPEG